MQVIMVYSEAGGVSKTTTAVSIAMTAALEGRRTTLIDLDPRAASTKWIGVEPRGEGLDVGAILGNEDPEGWVDELEVPSAWSDHLGVVPSSRGVSNREADRADHAELRLKTALTGVTRDLVVIDCPNRQGGPLTLAALNASDTVVYAATASQDGIDGVEGARTTTAAFMRSRERLGAPSALDEAGIVVGAVQDYVPSRAAKASIEALRETGLLLMPCVPRRAIVDESRMVGEWYGHYRKGDVVAHAYAQLAKEILR